MITETYKGRKIKAVKGKGADWGYARLTVNGVDLGKYLGDEANALRSAKGTIDHADEVGVGSARYQDYWYAPGTYELCENGHAQEIDGLCGHSYCIERRPVASATEPTPVKQTPSTIKITDRMAEALTDTALTEDGKTIRLTSRVRAGTTCALMVRGLVRYDSELTRENGYQVHTLTLRGMWVRGYLEGNPGGREFLASVMDAAVRKAGKESCNLCSGQPHTGPCDWMGPDPTETPAATEPTTPRSTRETDMDVKDFQHLIGTERTDERGLTYRVLKARYHSGSSTQGPTVTLSGRVTVSRPDGSNPNTPERPTYENSSWYDAYASEIFRPGDVVPARETQEEAAATEPTAPLPTVKRINVTPKMVEALENTIKISDRMAEALTDTVLIEETHRLHSVTVGTTVALMNRGLVRYDVTLSREEGYPVHTLTPRGRYLKGCLETCPDGREFLTSVVDGGVRKLAPVAPTGKANVREVSKVLKAAGFTPYNPERGGSRSGYQASQDGPRVLVRWREGADTDMMGDTEREDTRAGLNDAYADALTAAGYPMRGRAAGGRVAVSGSKGPARYATRNTADGVHEVVDRETGHVLSTEATSYEAREMADWYNASGFTGPAPETTSPVTEYSVKIWYRSGAYEGDMHCPEELARKIYADAAASDGVEFAELHGPSGKLVESRGPEPTA